jgi:hypothetical protein
MAPKKKTKEDASEKPEQKPSARYEHEDRMYIIAQAKERKAEIGNGGNFKKPFWTSISSALEKRQKDQKLPGGVRTWKSCSDQWKMVRVLYAHIAMTYS